MKTGLGTFVIIAALLTGFGIEIATHSVGSETALLKLGALPDNGQLNGQYRRLATYSFLHFNGAHLLVNVSLLFWVGRMMEKRVNRALAAAIYMLSVLFSAVVILIVHNVHPKTGATVGASGAVFGLLAAALVMSYRRDTRGQGWPRKWLWYALIAGLGISFLPGISIAGHIGGIIGGALPATVGTARKSDQNQTPR